MMKNPMYDSLLLHKPSREGIASSLFGDRRVAMAMPRRQASVDEMFGASVDVRAALDTGYGGYTDYPGFVLGAGVNGLGYLGAAATALQILPGVSFKADATPEQNELYKAFTSALNYGNCAKYSPTWSSWQPPSNGQLLAVTERMQEHKGSSDPRASSRVEAWKNRVSTAMRNVETYGAWECAGLDCCSNMECCPRSPSREMSYVAAMETLKAVLLEALSWPTPEEPILELDDYEPPPEDKPGDKPGGKLPDADSLSRDGSRESRKQRRGASTAGEMPGWALPVAGVALLGVLAGGLYFLKK